MIEENLLDINIDLPEGSSHPQESLDHLGSGVKALLPEISFEIDDGQVLDFVSFNPADQSFALNEKTIEYLASFQGNVSFVFNLGPSGVDKTSLFNQYLDIEESDFRFKESNKGFRIWSKAIYSEADHSHTFFVEVDSREDPVYQEFVWSFAYVFGSAVICSTAGEFSQNSLAFFEKLNDLSSKVTASEGSFSENLHLLTSMSPRLIWVAKDAMPFDHPDAFEQPDIYMDSFLLSSENDKTRNSILKLFRSRSCFVFPVKETSNAQLAEAIITENIFGIRDIIYSRVKPKVVQGVQLTAQLMIAFFSSAVRTHSPARPLEIKLHFQAAMDAVAAKSISEICADFLKIIPERLSSQGMVKAFRLLEIMREARFDSISQYICPSDLIERTGGAGHYFDQLNEKLSALEKDLFTQYEDTSKGMNEDFGQKLEERSLAQLKTTPQHVDALNQRISRAIAEYEEQSFGLDSLDQAVKVLLSLQTKAMQMLKPIDEEPKPVAPAKEVVEEKVEVLKSKAVIDAKMAEIATKKQTLQKALKALEDDHSDKYMISELKTKELEKLKKQMADRQQLFSKQRIELDKLMKAEEDASKKLSKSKVGRWWRKTFGGLCGDD